MGRTKAIEDVVKDLLRELGIHDDAPLLRTILIRDSYFAGEKYRFDGGFAVWRAEFNEIDVYDDVGHLLKTCNVEASGEGQAA